MDPLAFGDEGVVVAAGAAEGNDGKRYLRTDGMAKGSDGTYDDLLDGDGAVSWAAAPGGGDAAESGEMVLGGCVALEDAGSGGTDMAVGAGADAGVLSDGGEVAVAAKAEVGAGGAAGSVVDARADENGLVR